MRLLIDADVLLDLALDRVPHSTGASRVMEALQKGEASGFIAWHTVSNVYYMLSAGGTRERALRFIQDLSRLVDIAPVDSRALAVAISLKMRDFEDAMQVASALAANANAIVTRNVRDFRNSPVPAVRPEDLRL